MKNMKTFRAGIITILLMILISTFIISQKLYAANADKAVKVVSAIKDHKDKITIEREAILEDGRKLQEAKKTGDRAKIGQVKKETDLDIEKRKAAIRALYRDMDKANMSNANRKPKK